MDPISTLFAVYMSTVTNTVHQNVSDTYGTELVSKTITYQSIDVDFQYQIWKIKPKSVCSQYKQEMTSYSKCTVKAKSLFTALCKDLAKHANKNWKVKKLKNMYCNASVSYDPVIANISDPKKKSSQQKIEKECNVLILKTMGNKHKELVAERDLVCRKIQ